METADEKRIRLIRAIGVAFRELATDRDRIEVITAMTTVMKNQLVKDPKADGLLTEWMEQASATMEAIRMLWR